MTVHAEPQRSLLQVEHLRVTAHGGAFAVVDDVSFSVPPGRVTAIVGESGSGKTMVSRAILRLLPQGLEIAQGSVNFAGRDLLALPHSQLRQVRGGQIGMVFQEPMTSLNPALPIGRQLSEALDLHTGLRASEKRRRMIEMLDRVGIPDPETCLSAYPHEFSGGMRQRIMLASVMLLRPGLLIADEPTTALDAVVQQQVMNLMVDLTRETGTACLLISHDLPMVARYASHVIVMQSGRIVEQGATDDLLFNPRHDYTRNLLDALPRRSAARPAATGAPVIEASDLSVTFEGRRRLFSQGKPKRAVDDVTLRVCPGENVAVVGGSGSGKTTLGRTIVGLLQPSGGSIRFKGEPKRRCFDKDLQIVFQDPFSSLDPRMKIGQIVAEPLRQRPELDRQQRAERVRATLEDVGLSETFANRFPHQLSGGQRQRVAIARAIVGRPAVIVADEPVSALDMTVQKQILELFAQLQRSYGFACLFISHDLGAVEQIADRVLVMHEGRIVEEGPRDEIFDHPRHAYTRLLLAAANRLERNGKGYALSNRHDRPEHDTQIEGFG